MEKKQQKDRAINTNHWTEERELKKSEKMKEKYNH